MNSGAHKIALFCARDEWVNLQTYSPRHDGKPRIEDDIIRSAAGEGHYPLSDTTNEMAQIFRRSPAEMRSYYSTMNGPGDDHLSGRGYRLVAGLLLKDLERARLLERLAGAGSVPGR